MAFPTHQSRPMLAQTVSPWVAYAMDPDAILTRGS